MAANLPTLDDLQKLKTEIVDEIKKLLETRGGSAPRKWLKSHEVRRILTVSPGTLQNLRVNGTLPFVKIGGVIFYDYDDIQKMLEKHKHSFATIGRPFSN